MPKVKYEEIYNTIKKDILEHKFKYGDYLLSENEYTKIFHCSRNTIRRAISHLSNEGYVQAHHGKGVRIIYQEAKKHNFVRTGSRGMKQTAEENGYRVHSDVIMLNTMIVDRHLAEKTGFDEGIEVYFIKRVRSLNGIPKMIDTSLMRTDLVPNITEQVAKGSLFRYVEEIIGMEIKTIKRSITVERVTQSDEKYLQLDGYNCLAVMTSHSYNNKGDMFEYSQSRNRPDIFMFNSITTRN
ncbi:GntR family transcriptional regulator [Lacrimispora sp.]|uniref:GntR family transcriptional regulator n=1 Tax=Lacrimispora sp. TaxID=2719234 RepID=UPI0028A2C56B|nr:GntR family transcriptional regulator [Lacrimispora sp.]